MSKQFCDNCHNYLETNTTNDVLTFQCMTCFASYKSGPNDSLRYEDTNTGNLIIFQTILNKAKDDPVGYKEYVSCPKCKNDIVKQVRLGDEMRLINICENCSFQWIDINK